MSCGCQNTKQEEEKIIQSDIPLDKDWICKLKAKVCCEYFKFICRVFCGYIDDYSFIMNELNLIDLIEKYDYNTTDTKRIMSYFLYQSSGIKRTEKCVTKDHINIPQHGGSYERLSTSCGIDSSSYTNDFENIRQ